MSGDKKSLPSATDHGVAGTLRRARARIEKPGTWCQTDIARDADGEPTDPDVHEAVCWCALGALQAAGCVIAFECESEDMEGSDEDLAEWSFLHEEARRSGYASIEDFNDRQTHSEVLGLFDRAIARAEAA
jgi:hypothetical protein